MDSHASTSISLHFIFKPPLTNPGALRDYAVHLFVRLSVARNAHIKTQFSKKTEQFRAAMVSTDDQ